MRKNIENKFKELEAKMRVLSSRLESVENINISSFKVNSLESLLQQSVMKQNVFMEYIIAKEGLVCPVCGNSVKISCGGLKEKEYVVKCKCEKPCVSIRARELMDAIERFKKVKVDGENNG